MPTGRPPHLSILPALIAAASAFLAACASGGEAVGVAMVSWPDDLASAVDATLAAAPACGLQLTDERRDEKAGTALLVFLDEWQNPKPESALLTVRFEPAAGGISSRLEAHPLAEYGMRPPDIRAGSGRSACTPCSEARKEVPMVRYSRGQAMANAARTSRCLRGALEGAKPPGR